MKNDGTKELIEEFKERMCEFCNRSKSLGYAKLLGDEIVKPEIWRERHENFDKYFFEKIKGMSSMYV